MISDGVGAATIPLRWDKSVCIVWTVSSATRFSSGHAGRYDFDPTVMVELIAMAMAWYCLPESFFCPELFRTASQMSSSVGSCGSGLEA